MILMHDICLYERIELVYLFNCIVHSFCCLFITSESIDRLYMFIALICDIERRVSCLIYENPILAGVLESFDRRMVSGDRMVWFWPWLDLWLSTECFAHKNRVEQNSFGRVLGLPESGRSHRILGFPESGRHS